MLRQQQRLFFLRLLPVIGLCSASDFFRLGGLTPVHFIWIHPHLRVASHELNPKKAKALQVSREWMVHFPPDKYKLMFWTDREVRIHFPNLVPLLSRISVSAWISDVLRYFILYEFGGVYLDTDVLPVHNFTSLLAEFDSSITVCQVPCSPPTDSDPEIEGITSCESVINAIIAVPRGHPTVRCASERSKAYTALSVKEGRGWDYWVDSTGPGLWTSCVNSRGQITVLPSRTFLPCCFSERRGCHVENYKRFPQVYGMHEWTWSWRK